MFNLRGPCLIMGYPLTSFFIYFRCSECAMRKYTWQPIEVSRLLRWLYVHHGFCEPRPNNRTNMSAHQVHVIDAQTAYHALLGRPWMITETFLLCTTSVWRLSAKKRRSTTILQHLYSGEMRPLFKGIIF